MFVSLLYLVIQIRASRVSFEISQNREQLIQEFTSGQYFHDLRILVAADAELADIEVRGVRDLSSLSECEGRRFDDLLVGWIWAIAAACTVAGLEIEESTKVNHFWYSLQFEHLPIFL